MSSIIRRQLVWLEEDRFCHDRIFDVFRRVIWPQSVHLTAPSSFGTPLTQEATRLTQARAIHCISPTTASCLIIWWNSATISRPRQAQERGLQLMRFFVKTASDSKRSLNLCVLSLVPAESMFRRRSDVEYMQFVIQAFELEPGKWRARICRVDGAPIVVTGRRKQVEFVTAVHAKTAPAAALMAMKAIDAGTFRPPRPPRKCMEKFWRSRDRARKQPSPKMLGRSPHRRCP